MKKDFRSNLQFLFPKLALSLNHLNKNDEKQIKDELCDKMSSATIFIAIAMAIISIAVSLLLQIESGWKQIEVYGISSFVCDLVCLTLAITSIILKAVSYFNKDKNENKKNILNRLSIDALFVAILSMMAGSFYADSEKGFLSVTPTMSISITIISFLLIVQPIHALDAWILNSLVSVIMLFLSIYAKIQFDIQGFPYYIIITAVFVLMSRLVNSILFYAGIQKYIQESISNSLMDTAMYDELTHCKNRYALKKSLEKNIPLWKNNNSDLLIAMFDIDNFKEYNDYFSHQGGDGCLKQIANVVKLTFPSPNLEFYRYGGEEFLLIFVLDDIATASETLETLRKAVADLNLKAPPKAPKDYVTISIGGLFFEVNDEFDFNKSLSEVDANLYKAKSSGKDICFLNDKLIDNQ